MEASCWERLTVGEARSCSDGQAIFNKYLIQISLDGQGCIPSPLFDLRPNYGGGNENNGDLLQKVPGTHCPQPSGSPLSTYTSTSDSWTLTGKSRSVSCGVTAPFSWVLVGTRFCLYLQESVSPVLCKFQRFCGGANDITSFQMNYNKDYKGIT